MKTKSKCIGCQAIKLVNSMGLCKRCNRHAYDFISSSEIERMKMEREEVLAASSALKQAKKAEEDAKAEAKAAEGETEAGAEGTPAEEKGEGAKEEPTKGKGKEEDKDKTES